MADIKSKRAERLVAFRKLQRERASMEVENARTAMDTASRAVEAQKELIETEAKNAQSGSQTPSSPLDLQLALAIIDALRADLINKSEILSRAESTLDEKSKALLVTHRKVQQMEALKDMAAAKAEKEEKKKTQAEIDDLANSREARR